MKEVQITRQRIKSNVSFSEKYLDEIGPDGLRDRMRIKAIDDDDYRYPWDRGWIVTAVEIVSQYPDPKHIGSSIKVHALITETKTERVPTHTEEDKQ
ncbi:hypothetical protein MYRNA_54 [Mycobacterium phage Myrna]|uniref:Uncharacterized protein n=1 Tax=Mycobacterium phage Myrna TaxID=546805 RepID=B5LJ65_9CAUD|nr:gp54 [Mycobacterium phage Myrna]ACH62062.1 hypothetical protein MYRNA_54 [Mycobacterium phage Myrna]